jgi:hypothetical protein
MTKSEGENDGSVPLRNQQSKRGTWKSLIMSIFDRLRSVENHLADTESGWLKPILCSIRRTKESGESFLAKGEKQPQVVDFYISKNNKENIHKHSRRCRFCLVKS